MLLLSAVRRAQGEAVGWLSQSLVSWVGTKFGWVGAPAFMRGKERFSAPGRVSTLIMRFSAGSEKSQG